MSLREDKFQMIKDQVISKIHWGADDDEAREFLETKGIAGADADRILREAWRARRREIRVRAILVMVFSGIGLVITGGYLWMIHFAGAYRYSSTRILYATAIAAGIALFCAGAFLRALWRFLSGRTVGAVD